MKFKNVLLKEDPITKTEIFDFVIHTWEGCCWISNSDYTTQDGFVAAYRRRFKVERDSKVRIHVSADQRYLLYIDGEFVDYGPDRGDHLNWFYKSYDLELEKGSHNIVAIVSFAGNNDLRHMGHLANSPAFMLHTDDENFRKVLDTGMAAWETLTLDEMKLVPQDETLTFTGAILEYHASEVTNGLLSNKGNASGRWVAAKKCEQVIIRSAFESRACVDRLLRHSLIPSMIYNRVETKEVRFAKYVSSIDYKDFSSSRIFEKDCDKSLCDKAETFLKTGKPLKIEANKKVMFLFDNRDYICAFTKLNVSGGKGSCIKFCWTESLYKDTKHWRSEKGNRDEIDGKYFRGIGDKFYPDGSKKCEMHNLWWNAGRYILCLIETTDEPLTINSIEFYNTHYPIKYDSKIVTSDKKYGKLEKMLKRTLEVCSHETFFDCPYFEQLMYTGDTRVEILTTYVLSKDWRLPKKAITLFNESRSLNGLPLSRTPADGIQIIPGFALWWIGMVYDNMMWRDDIKFVKENLLGARSVGSSFCERIKDDGLYHAFNGWNFMDWVVEWDCLRGVPPNGHIDGVSATENIQLVYVLQMLAEIERNVGDNNIAKYFDEVSEKLAKKVVETFWRDEDKMFAETPSENIFTEHAQSLAVIAGIVPDIDGLKDALLTRDDLHRTTIYFSFYLFEAYRMLGCIDALYERLKSVWYEMTNLGVYTALEKPEPSRSDCHAWSTHPIYHMYVSFAGIRPIKPKFEAVEIAPQLGVLDNIDVKMIHPSGSHIKLQIQKTKEGLYEGEAVVPEGVSAILILPNKKVEWIGGKKSF